MSQEKSKTEYKFDLSDGFGKEDVGGIFITLFRFIWKIITIVLYPYFWMGRMINRSIAFLRSKKDPNSALEPAERDFVETIPGFFILSGIFIGLFFGAFIFFADSAQISSFFDNINLTSIIDALAALFGFILEIILWIIGVDKRDAAGNVTLDRFGLLDLFFDVIFKGLADFFRIIFDDPLMLFVGIGLVGFLVAIIWIIVSETGVVSAIVNKTLSVFSFLIKIPRQVYNYLDSLFWKVNDFVGGLVIGDERLDNRNIGFHKKVVKFSYALGLWTFFGGIFVLIVEVGDKLDGWPGIAFIFAILVAFGFGVGILEIFLITRVLDTVSKKKYIAGSSEASTEE